MRYPVRKIHITQSWGNDLVINGVHIYKKFGFLGHNGLDLRIFNNQGIKDAKGDLIAPHHGEVIEAGFDEDGYGWYYKIENDEEGSILGHNSELFLKVGDRVKEGQVIGITGNTGLSTSPHVHWGYYRKPRNRKNGYGGTINPIQYIENNKMPDNENELTSCRISRDSHWNGLVAIRKSLGLKEDAPVKEILDSITSLKNKILTQSDKMEEYVGKINRLNREINGSKFLDLGDGYEVKEIVIIPKKE